MTPDNQVLPGWAPWVWPNTHCRESDPNHHTLDTLEQCMAVVLERLTVAETGRQGDSESNRPNKRAPITSLQGQASFTKVSMSSRATDWMFARHTLLRSRGKLFMLSLFTRLLRSLIQDRRCAVVISISEPHWERFILCTIKESQTQCKYTSASLMAFWNSSCREMNV